MRKPYFLTRQTANLMEDFVRELKSGCGVYLLYGDEGIGKTRLLEELAQNRLQDAEVCWIDLKAGGSGEGALVDSSVMIESSFATAKTGDVIIADHFEMALKKSRHQLFLSWSTDGADKQINMIIAGNTSYYNELRQLAQQYQLRAQSFQMMPFSADEATAFLGFYLFPDRPVGKLTIPSLIRNQIAMAHGSVSKIVEIAERAGDQISSEPLKDTRPIRKGSRVIVGVLIAVAAILAGAWYFLGGSTQMEETPVTGAESSATTPAPVKSSSEATVVPDYNQAPAAAEGLVERTTEVVVGDTADDLAPAAAEGLVETTTDVVVGDTEDDQAPAAAEGLVETTTEVVVGGTEDDQAPIAAEGFVERTADEVVGDTEDDQAASQGVQHGGAGEQPAQQELAQIEVSDSESEVDVEVRAATDSVDELRTAPPAADELQASEVQDETANNDSDLASDSPAEPASEQTTIAVVLPALQSQPDRLLQDLQTSLDWINSRDSKVGTIQILLLSQNRFDDQVYYEYLDRLKGQGVDILDVRIFATYTGGQRVFSVVYGEYQSRAAANAAKKSLPAILRDTAPIGRSVGGLMEEIQRLEGKN